MDNSEDFAKCFLIKSNNIFPNFCFYLQIKKGRVLNQIAFLFLFLLFRVLNKVDCMPPPSSMLPYSFSIFLQIFSPLRNSLSIWSQLHTGCALLHMLCGRTLNLHILRVLAFVYKKTVTANRLNSTFKYWTIFMFLSTAIWKFKSLKCLKSIFPGVIVSFYLSGIKISPSFL